jgi:hypothetical protein
MHLLLTAILLAAPPSPDQAAASAAPGGGNSDRAKVLGLSLSAGAPQGFVLSAVARPVPWLRGNVGVAHNILGVGVQGGVTAIPFDWAVAPTLTLELGRFFETDQSDRFGGTFPDAFDPALRKFGYDFYSAQLGLEFGSQRSFLFFVRGGLAWVRSGLGNVENFHPEGSRPGTTVDASNVTLRATVPTANLGFVFYVW